jgi:hypothetical protein
MTLMPLRKLRRSSTSPLSQCRAHPGRQSASVVGAVSEQYHVLGRGERRYRRLVLDRHPPGLRYVAQAASEGALIAEGSVLHQLESAQSATENRHGRRISMADVRINSPNDVVRRCAWVQSAECRVQSAECRAHLMCRLASNRRQGRQLRILQSKRECHSR